MSNSTNTLHLHPATFPLQRTLSCFIRIIPPTRLRSFHDLHDNITHHFEIQSPHQRLEIESLLKVQNLPLEITAADRRATLDVYRDPETSERTWTFLQPSHFVAVSPEIWRQAIDLTRDTESVLEKAEAILSWVNENFEYLPDSTHVHSRLDEVFEGRTGVCQDFTHVMLGLCRSAGIPARYASGYLYNGPSDTLLGAQASHAWAEIYLPECGWIGLDPTNGTLADERYIKLAIGRDYDDVAPVKGSYSGTSQCRMEVDVKVTLL